MIQTKASIAKQIKADSDFKVIKFDGLKSSLPKSKFKMPEENKSESEDSEFERIFGDGPKKKKTKRNKKEVTLESARREIINFGISGSSASEKLDLNQQLAIKLGAKPPKKPARNYKEILEEKRNLKEKEKTINRRTIFGTSASLQYRNQKRKPSQKNDGLLKRYGKVEKEKPETSGKSYRKRKR
ncbi:CLUMA_CG003112, isoform A [Clunio marinus]|uniref:CLUMA_CG003112, isoform A n=1 Tax=Clunio marinus TaxID=568069 RepID=A0A1J1HP97_9DIPT|nr:CLUMA_CG003112, isoform A [Clunio marinus]